MSAQPYPFQQMIPRALAVLFGLVWVLEGTRSILQPHKQQLADFGVAPSPPPPRTKKGDPKPQQPTIHTWIILSSARTLTFGCVVCHLAYARQWRVVGTILCWAVGVGVAEAMMAGRYGTSRRKVWEHVVGTSVLGVTGAALLWSE